MNQSLSQPSLNVGDANAQGILQKHAFMVDTWPDLISTDENPTPPDATVQWVDNQGVNLRCARWPALKKPVLGTICLVQGRTEFIEKYYEVIHDLQNRGFAVLAFDFRGQGGSDRLLKQARRGHVDSFWDYVSDLEAVVSEVLLPECPAPFFALAHSMGATVVLNNLQKGRRFFDRAVLTAPLIALESTRRRQNNIMRASQIMNGLGMGEWPIPFARTANYEAQRFDGNVLTSDRTRFERTDRLKQIAPFLKIGVPTIGWVNAACQAMSDFEDPQYGANNRNPILIIASGNDKVVSLEAIEKLCYNMRSAGYIMIPGALHEIMQERDLYRDQFWAAFDAFIPGTEHEIEP